MIEFSTRRVDRKLQQSVETLGSKPKFWFRDGEQRLLFKAEERGTGEDWAEVVSCELCRLLGLPHVVYELAMECEGEKEIRPGAVCANIAPPPFSLVLGNQLLLAIDPKYPKDHRSKFKVQQHTVEAVCDVVSELELPGDSWMTNVPTGIESALDVLAGYVMLDAWIANPDRHHENWGAVWDGGVFRLAPTFDHGSALARNLLDSRREEALMTKDQNRTVLAFAEKGRSAFYHSPADARALGLLDAFLAFAQRAPRGANAWVERLQHVTSDALEGILNRVPVRRMTGICKRFTLELLLTNQQRFLDRKCG